MSDSEDGALGLALSSDSENEQPQVAEKAVAVTTSNNITSTEEAETPAVTMDVDDLFGEVSSEEDEEKKTSSSSSTTIHSSSAAVEGEGILASVRHDSFEAEGVPLQLEYGSLEGVKNVVPGRRIVSLKLPPMIAIQPAEFDADTFTPSREEIARASTHVIRWQRNKETGELESNAKIVTWDDGSKHLFLGNEPFRVTTQEKLGARGTRYVYAKDAEGIVASEHGNGNVPHVVAACHGEIMGRMVVVTDAKSSAHQKFSADLRKKHARKGKMALRLKDEQVSMEVLMAKQEERDREADREKKRREAAKESSGRRSGRRVNQFSSAFIEEGMSGEEDSEDGGGARRRYSDEDDDQRAERLRAAKQHESEEEEVDFEAESARVRGRDEEAEEEEDEEEEEDIEEDDNDAPVQRRAKRRKISALADSETDSE